MFRMPELYGGGAGGSMCPMQQGVPRLPLWVCVWTLRGCKAVILAGRSGAICVKAPEASRCSDLLFHRKSVSPSSITKR